MPELSETEMRILSVLEELEYENVPAMMNTVMQPAGDVGELAEMQWALENLVQRDYAIMTMDLDSSGKFRRLSKDESMEVIADLRSGLRFNGDRTLWIDTRRKGPPFGLAFPFIVSTHSGRVKGREILEERGYQWWRAEK